MSLGFSASFLSQLHAWASHLLAVEAKGQKCVSDDPRNASALKPRPAKSQGRCIAALVLKVNDLLDFNPAVVGAGPTKAPGKLCRGTIWDVSGRGMCWEVGWVHPACTQELAGSAGHVPRPVGPRGQAAAAEHVPSPVLVAMQSLFAAAAGLGSPCPVSSRCSRITMCMVSLQRFLSAFFAAERLSCLACSCGEMLASGLAAGALGSLLLQQLLLLSGPGPCFLHSPLLKTVSSYCPWAVFHTGEQCLGCFNVLFGCQASQCCPNTFPLRSSAVGRYPALAEHPMPGAAPGSAALTPWLWGEPAQQHPPAMAELRSPEIWGRLPGAVRVLQAGGALPSTLAGRGRGQSQAQGGGVCP